MKSLLLFLPILMLAGCATAMKDCPTVDQEAVSQCRAKAACHIGSFGSTMALMFAGAGAGGNGRNQAASNQDSCMERELNAQRANAGQQVQPVIRCESTNYSNGTDTVCRQN